MIKPASLALALFLLLATTPLRADPPATAPATTTPATAPTEDPAHWQTTLRQLAADDYAQRTAAQKELDAAGPAQLDLLRQSATHIKNPEIQARINARIAAIEDDLAVNPPPISLELHDASADATAAALSKALGVHIRVWPPFQHNGTSFTIAAHNKPFWNVFIELAQQHDLVLRDMGDGLAIMVNTGQKSRHAVILGPVAIFPQNITRQRTANLQNDPGSELSPETMQFWCLIAIDPRIHITRFSPPQFTSITDDTGELLFSHKPDAQLWDVHGRAMPFDNISTLLQLPEKSATRITSASGLIHYVAQTKASIVEVKDAEKHVGEEIHVGNRKLKLARFTVTKDPNSTSITVGLEPDPNPAIHLPFLNSNPPVSTLTIIDATGNTVFTTDASSGMGASLSGNYTAPFTLRFSTPTRTHEISLPFDLKNLPLP